MNDDPNWADPADSGGDPIQVVWLSSLTINGTDNSLRNPAVLYPTPKIAALAKVHLYHDYRYAYENRGLS